MAETVTREIAGIKTHLRRSGGTGPVTLFVHGNPTGSWMWEPFLERLHGPAVAPDLPCFGASERPGPERFTATMDAYADWVAALIESELGDGYKLVVQDWGGIALAAAARRPELVQRLVVIDAVPLLAGYRWHWIARIWRRRGAGELFNAAITPPGLRLILRQARADHRPMPAEFTGAVWEHLDRGTKRAILALYRSAGPVPLERAGARLAGLDCPALVVWGRADPYIPAEFGERYAQVLGAELELHDAGHWPWYEQPGIVERVCGFLDNPVS